TPPRQAVQDFAARSVMKASALSSRILRLTATRKHSGWFGYRRESSMAAGYSTTAKFFHWTAAFLILTIVPMGLLMGRIPDGPLKDNLFHYHKSVGALILFVMTLRLIYRFSKGAPPPEPSLKPWEILVSETVHWTLYAMLLATPLVALWAYSVYGQPAPFFGIFTIGPFTAKNEHFAERLFYV